MKHSNIEWTDHTFNPWIGCTKVSPACEHCYAEYLAATRFNWAQWGPLGKRKRIKTWNAPIKWNKEAQASGKQT